MTALVIVLALAGLAPYVCRRRIKRAVKRQVRKAEDKLAELIVECFKRAGRVAWFLACELFKAVSLA